MTLRQADLENLPKCVQHYLLTTGVVGTQRIETVLLKQKGLFNVNNRKWTGITAQQSVDVKNCSFVWKAKAGPFQVTDQFDSGVGSLIIKLFGIIPLKKFRGKEVDQGEISRFLAEMIWYPTAFTESFISWNELGEHAAGATIHSHQTGNASIQFSFDHNNLILSITGKRYREQNGLFSLENWLINGLEYQRLNGIMMPYKAQVCWELDGKVLPYYKLEITEIKFNSSEF